MALPGCEYSCAACFCSKSVSRAVMLLIACESANFHTVVKEIPICEDFAWVRGEVPVTFKRRRWEMLSWNIQPLLKYFIPSERFPGSLSMLLCQTHLFFFPWERLESRLIIQLSIAALFSRVYTFLDQTLYNLTRNHAITVGDGKKQHNLFYKQRHHPH